MTISDTATKFRYQGNASTDTFAFSGKAFTAADLVVEIITRATDVLEETLTLTTDYSVTILTDGTASIVTVAGKIPSATQDIQIRRALTQTQTTSLPVGTVFPAKLVENSLDRAVGLSQDLEEAVTRSLKFPATSSTTVATLPEPTDDAVLAFDGTTGLFKVGATNTSLVAGATAAAASASAASTSASNASTSASNASTSEANAAASETAAAASAAGVNLPSITATDTGKLLLVNAAGTAHELIASNGTSGQVLTSAGADALPSYTTITTGSMVLLETQTASASATIDFTTGIDSTYTNYKIICSNVHHSVNSTTLLTVSTDGGSTYQSTSYKRGGRRISASSGTFQGDASVSDSSINIASGASASTGTGENSNFEILIYNPSDTANYKLITARGGAVSTDLNDTSQSGAWIGGVAAVNAIRIAPSAGNFVTGTFKLYGVL